MTLPPVERVDVGVVTWNTSELTVRALRHLLDSDQGCEIRILVHDNASSDGTVGALADLVPEADVEASAENVGFARGMNRLIARSDAPWFFALNSDAWPEPGAIGRLVQSARDRPRSAIVAPLLLRPDGSTEHSTHPFPSLKVAAIDAVGGRRWMSRALLQRLLLEGAWAHDRARDVDWVVGAALLMRREALDELGGFDDRFFMYVEDLEWCWRAGRAGWEIRFDPGAVVRHVGGVSSDKRFKGTRTALEAANLRVLLPETLGKVRSRVYWGLQALACSERLLAASLRRRDWDVAVWRAYVVANLGISKPPEGTAPRQVDRTLPPRDPRDPREDATTAATSR